MIAITLGIFFVFAEFLSVESDLKFFAIFSTSSVEYSSGLLFLIYFHDVVNDNTLPFWAYVNCGFHWLSIMPAFTTPLELI